MASRTSARVRPTVTFLVTAVIVLSEFTFLMTLYHLGDHVDEQRVAQARVSGTVEAWRPGDGTGAVVRAVRGLAAIDSDAGGRLLSLADRWVDAPTQDGLDRLDRANGAVGDDLVRDQHLADLRTALILATVLVLVSVGWFAWFRRLVQRHRALQRAVTERQVLDAGERRLMALVRNSVDLVAVLEPDSTASFVSPSSCAVLGHTPDELAGRPFTELLQPLDVPVFMRLLAAPRDGEQAVLLGMRHADGRELTVEGTLNNLRAEEAVGGLVLTVRDVTERERLQAELSYLAFHDALTGLANRQLFADRLAHALRRRDGVTQPLVVMLLDLDDFKQVNDSLGHGVGDQLLVTAAARISAAVRVGDTAARLGGDEFAILLEDATIETAREVADRLLDALAVPVSVGDTTQSVRASIGMTEATPGWNDSEEILRNADVAMYWAKDRGKGTVACYEAGLHAEALGRTALRGELERALDEDQLVLHYQPIVDLDTRRITGFEALVRWQHPTRGLLAPVEFISLAEQSGMILPLGRWVLREACRAGATLQDATHRPSMAVNIAALQLAEPSFVDEVAAVLETTGLPTDRLVLEITESVLLEDMPHTVAALTFLREHGVRVAIDDFGTGYSSLSYLAQLPVDVLKVDKSFIDQVGGEGDTLLVEAIIAMSRSMRLATVAEGVEHLEQASWLEAARCSMGQGFLWSRPVPLETARELLVVGVSAGGVAPLAGGLTL